MPWKGSLARVFQAAFCWPCPPIRRLSVVPARAWRGFIVLVGARSRADGKSRSEASLKLFLTKYLAGVGVARQRKAIVDGLKNSISDFTSNEQIKGASSKDVVDLLLITQYFDMLNSIGTRPDTLTVFIDEDGE